MIVEALECRRFPQRGSDEVIIQSKASGPTLVERVSRKIAKCGSVPRDLFD